MSSSLIIIAVFCRFRLDDSTNNDNNAVGIDFNCIA